MRTLVLLFCFIVVCRGAICDGKSFVIQDDVSLNSIIAEAREEFLASRPTTVDVLDVSLLLPEMNGNQTVWSRGTYQPYELGYPASTVKLAYMAASVQWCHKNGRPSNCLDQHVRPMIKNSDNLQTGIIVDICSGAPNINLTSTSDSLFQPWYDKRLWAMNYLKDNNLLGNQTINVKTYPTNTGQTLWGAEYLSWDEYGRNAMCAQCAASLMLEVTKGGLYGVPTQNSDLYGGATGYMRGLLSHEMWSGESSFGFGIPPGSVIHNKIGVAYNNLNDIALIKLPSGYEFIVSVYSTGYESDQPYPYDGSNLGVFLYFLLDKLDILQDPCSPPILTYNTTSTNFEIVSGTWTAQSSAQALGKEYQSTLDFPAMAHWNVDIPSDGLYEVAVWSPQSESFSTSTVVTVNSVNGAYNYVVSQQSYGARWYKLGDFYLLKGTKNVVSISSSSDSLETVANAIKITKWPECHNSPGATCQDFVPAGPTCNSH